MGTQLVLSFAKRLFFNLCNALNPKPNSQTIRILSPYRNISLFSLVFILIYNQLSSFFLERVDSVASHFINLFVSQRRTGSSYSLRHP